MSGQGESPPPPEEGLARDRCPSCGGKLTYEPGRDQGFCAIEGIYVEVLVRPPEEADRPPLVREAILHATKKDLQRLCKAYGQRTSGNKTDLLTRLLRYMDEHGIDLPPEEVAEGAAPEPEPEVSPEPAEATKAAPAGSAPPPGPDIDTLLAEVEHLASQAPPVDSAAEPPRQEPRAESAPAIPATPPEETFLLEAAGLAAAAPSEPAVEEVPAEAELPLEPPAEELAAISDSEEEVRVPPTPAAPEVDAQRLRRDRIAFYFGTLLVAAGGPGLIFGSVLHDVMRMQLIGDAFEVFGSLNAAAALAGGAILAAGLVAMGLGLRGGIVAARPARDG